MDLYGVFEHELWPGEKITGARVHAWLDLKNREPIYSAQLKTKAQKRYSHVLRKGVGCVYFGTEAEALAHAKKLKTEHNQRN